MYIIYLFKYIKLYSSKKHLNVLLELVHYFCQLRYQSKFWRRTSVLFRKLAYCQLYLRFYRCGLNSCYTIWQWNSYPFLVLFFCLFFCLSALSQMWKGKISKPVLLRIYGLLARLMLLYFIFRVSLKFWKFGLKNHLEVRPFFIMTGQLQEEFF